MHGQIAVVHDLRHRVERAVRIEGRTAELARAIAADAAADHGRAVHIYPLRQDRNEDAATRAPARRVVSAVVIGKSRHRLARHSHAVFHIVVKVGVEAEGFDMDLAVADGRLPGRLGDHIRHVVDRVIIIAVQLARTARRQLVADNSVPVNSSDRHRCARSRAARERTGRAARRLRHFGGGRQPERVAEVLDQADLRLTRPSEAGDVLCVDRQRNDFIARRDALIAHRDERPGLAGEEMHADVVPVESAIEMADARRVGIALARVGGDAGGQEVELAIGGCDRGRVDLAFRQERHARLAGGAADLVHMRERAVVFVNAAEGGAEVAARITRTPHTFRRQEAAGGEGDAVQMELLVPRHGRGIGRPRRRIDGLAPQHLLRHLGLLVHAMLELSQAHFEIVDLFDGDLIFRLGGGRRHRERHSRDRDAADELSRYPAGKAAAGGRRCAAFLGR